MLVVKNSSKVKEVVVEFVKSGEEAKEIKLSEVLDDTSISNEFTLSLMVVDADYRSTEILARIFKGSTEIDTFVFKLSKMKGGAYGLSIYNVLVNDTYGSRHESKEELSCAGFCKHALLVGKAY